MKTDNKLVVKWSIALKVLPIVVFVTVLKYLSHRFGFEVMELNALFSSLVAGTIFLIGFLISGVLTDYKESEKLPSELVAALNNLHDDATTIRRSRKSEGAGQLLLFLRRFTTMSVGWLYKKERTKAILEAISSMNEYFIQLENEGVQANYIIKMKNDQNNIRKIIMRIDTIRDTQFIGSAYAIVELMGLLTAFGLIIIRIEPFYASLFMTLLITFLVSYMVFLIKDLDNPFDYASNGEKGTEVSLKPLHDFEVFVREQGEKV